MLPQARQRPARTRLHKSRLKNDCSSFRHPSAPTTGCQMRCTSSHSSSLAPHIPAGCCSCRQNDTCCTQLVSSLVVPVQSTSIAPVGTSIGCAVVLFPIVVTAPPLVR